LVTASSLAIAGCGGDAESGPPPPDPGDPPPGAIEIFGGERLGWNQAAPDPAAVRSYSYTLHVDNTPANPGMSDVRCGETAGPAGYECSGLLPTLPIGVHTLQLSTTDKGRASPLSAGLTVSVVQRASTPGSEAKSGLEGSEAAPTTGVCFEASSPRDCYGVESLASGLGRVREMTAASAKRIYFVEDSRDVRVLANRSLVTRPVLRAPEGTTISGLATDTNYESNRLVYAALTTATDGGHSLQVVRYRDVGGALGQAAIIVPDLPVASSGARIAFGSDRRLYVAMPRRSRDSPSSRDDPYDGFVLRFSEDGTVPHTARGSSPVYAHGFANPTALLAGSTQLWFVGTGGIEGSLAFLDTAESAREWPRIAESLRLTVGPETSVRPTAASVVQHAHGAMLLYVSQSSSIIHRATIPAGAVSPARVDRLILPSSAGLGLTAVSAAPNGEITVAAGNLSLSTSEILQLTPQ
jgi:hypothetical protein